MSEDGRYIVVDSKTGEGLERSDYRLSEYEAQVKGLQRDVRAWTMRFDELKRDRAKAAKHHPLFDEVEIAFRHWKQACNHKRSPYTADRFWLALPYLENPKYGLKLMLRAIEGAAFDAFEVTRKNGSKKRFDEWERIFKDAGTFEEFCNKAPRKPNEEEKSDGSS